MSNGPSHPSPEALNAFSLGQLSSDEAAAVESHVIDCQPCCETMLGLSSDDTFVAQLQEANELQETQAVDRHDAPVEQSAFIDGIPAELAAHPRYEIDQLIGSGGMGAVYRTRHRVMDRTVALKIINRDLVRRNEAVDRFRREVKAAARLSHPNIVTAHDAEQAGDVHFLVMEYVDGVDLSQLVGEQGALSIADACEYCRQAAVGLQHAHGQGMVHRDIKPHNLMLTADGTVKILDFGLASLAPDATPDEEPAQSRGDLTAAGAIVGTPDFISPEQASDAHQADIRSDIYSLGATLYFLLTGRPLFADGSVMHKLQSHAEAEPEPLDSSRSDVPAGLAQVVSRMTAKNPEERFQTPVEVAEALEPFSTDLQVSQSQARTRSPLPLLNPHGALRYGVAAVLLVVAAIAAVSYFPEKSDGPFMIGGGAVVSNDDWRFSSGSLYLQKNEPGVLFGMHEDPKGNRELSYVVLFRHNASDSTSVGRPEKSGLSFDGHVATSRSGIALDGNEVRLDLEVQLDDHRLGIESTKASINGNQIDYSKGRLILVDLTLDGGKFQQVDAKFPTDLPSLRDISQDTEVVTKLARQLLALDGVWEFLAWGSAAEEGTLDSQKD